VNPIENPPGRAEGNPKPLISGSQVRALVRPPPSPFEPGIFPPSSDRPFVPGFARLVSGPFGLCWRMLFLAAVSVALSLHPKIPFLADKAQRLTSGFVAREPDPGGVGHGGRRYCCGFNPSASNCRLHSAGASRRRSMLMPRGRRPSAAARTSLGAPH
jgi:hypothetical protein